MLYSKLRTKPRTKPQQQDKERNMATSTATSVSSVLSASSPHPVHDVEMTEAEMEMAMNEMKKMYEAKSSQRQQRQQETGGYKGIDKYDMSGEEIAIVCEELWADFRLWMSQHRNLAVCANNAKRKIRGYFVLLFCVLVFLVGFRWYIGGGKDACDYGVGWVMWSLVCEIMRNVGEVLMAIFVIIGGLCCVLLPIMLSICLYEMENIGNEEGEGECEGGQGDKEKKD